MSEFSMTASCSSFVRLFLLAGALSACASEGMGEWEADTDLEVDSLEQPFSTGAVAVTAAENGAAPFVSTVKFDLIDNCTGIKIPPLTSSTRVRILTAAHCVSERSSVRSVTITNNLAGNAPATVNIPANRTFIHPSFQLGDDGDPLMSKNLYDIAFFEVDSGVTFAQTPTTFAVIQGGVSLTGVGYGRAGADCAQTGGTKLKAAVQSSAVASGSAGAHFIHTLNGIEPCPGDSGGPLLQGSGTSARVVGITSHVSESGLAGYTRVSNVLEWLNDPVDSTLGASTLLVNNSTVYLMNGAESALDTPKLGCAAMDGTGTVSGTNVRIHGCDGPDGIFSGNAPAWRLLTSPAGGGSFKIVNRRSGLCLGAADSTLFNVVALTCATTAGAALNRQSWVLEQVAGARSSTGFRLKPMADLGRCLNAGAGAENDNVVLAACSTAPAHKWYLTR